MTGWKKAKIATLLIFSTFLITSVAASHSSNQEQNSHITGKSSSTGILNSLFGIFNDFQKPDSPAVDEKTESQKQDEKIQTPDPISENNQEHEESEKNNRTSPIGRNQDSTNSRDSIRNCPSIKFEVVQKSSNSAVLQQVAGEKAAGKIRITWFYEDEEPLNKITSIYSNRGIVKVETAGEIGELKNVSVTKLDCGKAKSTNKEAESESKSPEAELDVNQTQNPGKVKTEDDRHESEFNKISVRFEKISVESAQQSPWILPSGLFPEKPTILVKVSTPSDSAYGCIEENRKCKDTSEILDNWNLILDAPENKKSETTVKIEVYDHSEAENNLGEQIDINGKDSDSKSISLEFSTNNPKASPSLTASGEGDSAEERDGRIEVKLTSKR